MRRRTSEGRHCFLKRVSNGRVLSVAKSVVYLMLLMELFVTVGTTRHEKLIQEFCTESMCKILSRRGFTRVYIQTGLGTTIPQQELYRRHGLELEVFPYKESIASNIRTADLIIGHAGAGTIMETVSACKPFIAVPNETLLDNHQSELANKMASENHIFTCSHRDLEDYMANANLGSLKWTMEGNPKHFGRFVENLFPI